MKNSEYWKRRFEQLEDENYAKTESYYKDVEKQFRMAQNSVQADIEKWYWRLADNNDISYAAAKKLLKKNELEEFHWTVEEYIKYGQENSMNQKWMKELENASARVHISRLEAIKLQIQQEAEKLFLEYEGATTEFLKRTYADGFYHTAFGIARGTGVGSSLAKLDSDTIEKLIKKPWAQDGSNFSDRIWANKKKLVNVLHTELAQNVIRGESQEKAAKRVAEQMGASMRQARTLVYTESAAIASGARRDCLKDLGVEQYEIVATLDSKTSDICREMDGKVFDMKEYQVGLTAPPFHCNCRSCTCPYFNDEFTVGEERVARSEETGRTYYVPADMKYLEWKEKFVDKDAKEPKSVLTLTEIGAIIRYVSPDSYVLNDKLRHGDELTEEEKEWIIDLDNALDKMQDYEGIVYRSVSDFGIGDVDEFINSYVPGCTKEFPSYISSSENVYDESFSIQYAIWSKHGKDIREYNQKEKEVLFKRNSKFKVIRVEKNIIYLEEK
ncbi:MAG: minor capsid protein [Acetivibrio ethanolgignens]